jgi:hypothetical protein
MKTNPNVGRLPFHDDLVITSVSETNWVQGTFRGKWFEAKIFATPSTFGINHGRVSKLCISKTDKWVMLDKKHVMFNYDRGEDIDNPIGHDFAALWDGV